MRSEIVFVVALIVGCRQAPVEAKRDPVAVIDTGTPEAQVEPTWSDASLTLERTACYGTCPVYTVTVHGDGRVEYVGKSYVRVFGRATSTADVGKVRALFKRAWDAGFFEWKDRYAAAITDHPTAFVTFRAGGKSKAIEHYAPSESNGPKELSTLEQEIARLADVAQWIVCRDAKGAEVRCRHSPPMPPPGGGACDPPYVVDASGMKRFKPECL